MTAYSSNFAITFACIAEYLKNDDSGNNKLCYVKNGSLRNLKNNKAIKSEIKFRFFLIECRQKNRAGIIQIN